VRADMDQETRIAGSPTLSWSRSFLLLDADQTVAAGLHEVYRSGEDYVLVERQDPRLFYAYRYEEILAPLNAADRKRRLRAALELRENDVSRPVQSEDAVPTDQSSGGPPFRHRLVKVDQKGRPVSIGESATGVAAAMRSASESRSGRDRRIRSGSQADRNLQSRPRRKIPKGEKAKRASKAKSSRKKRGRSAGPPAG
jgi:hypothetical protein